MLSFTSDYTYTVKGRGVCFALNEKLPKGYYDPNQLVGEQILINGQEYTVKGTETFTVGRSPGNPYRFLFSVLT